LVSLTTATVLPLARKWLAAPSRESIPPKVQTTPHDLAYYPLPLPAPVLFTT